MNLLFIFIFLASSSELKDVQPTALYDQEGQLCEEDPTGKCVHWPPLNNANGQNNKWRGVGQLFRNGEGGCTVNLIKIPNCPKPKKPQVVTNGHCVSRQAKFSVKFGMFADSKPQDQMSVNATTIYGSYHTRDIGIMELDTDYDSLVKVIKPFEIGREKPNQSAQYETVGIPVNGLPKSQQYMRHGVCTPAGENKTVITEKYLWESELAFTGCSLRGGSSGSGLFDNGKIYGLVHAGALNDKALQNNPNACLTDTCVLDANNNPRHEKVNYGYDITNLHKCYKDCQLDTKLPGCLLPDPESKIAFSYQLQLYNNTLKKRFDIESNFTKFQVKGCKGGDAKCSCSDPSGYKEHSGKSISAAPFFDDGDTYKIAPNADPEFRFLCVRGQNADGTLDAEKNMVQLPIHLKNYTFGGIKK